ncbi:hypothetical protein [Massilia sp. TN1-12]|uniref:hypothetical protein n=1 Tax=Massilia paldalensis TaxID=3377675 RepID=UPI0038506FE0
MITIMYKMKIKAAKAAVQPCFSVIREDDCPHWNACSTPAASRPFPCDGNRMAEAARILS